MITSVSKKLRNSIVVIHYCRLSQFFGFFWNRHYDYKIFQKLNNCAIPSRTKNKQMCISFDPNVFIFTLSLLYYGGSVSGLTTELCIDSYAYDFFMEISECWFRNSFSYFFKLWLLQLFSRVKMPDFDKWRFLTNVWVTFVESTI